MIYYTVTTQNGTDPALENRGGEGVGGRRVAVTYIPFHDKQKIIKADPMNYLAIDTETGGLDSSECALLSVALVPSWDAPPLNLCILPEGRIEARAAEVNGYTPELWAERGAIGEKMAGFEMLNWLHDHTVTKTCFQLVAHNAGFDSLFLAAWQHRVGIDFELPGIWHCTQIKLKALREDGILPSGSNNLDTLGTLSGFWEAEKRSEKHDALQDARCALHGFQWILEKRKGAAHE